MDGTIRSNIKPGIRVLIVLREDQGSGKTTEGPNKISVMCPFPTIA